MTTPIWPKMSWTARLKSRFHSGNDTDGSTFLQGSSTETLRIPFEGFNTDSLPFMKTVDDKIAFVNSLMAVLPEDLDYNYFDGEVDNYSPGRRVACAVASDAFEHIPDNPDLLYALCYFFLIVGDYEKSLSCSLKLVKRQHNDGVAWGNIAWCQMKLGNSNEAFKSSEKALKFLPNNANVYDTHAAILSGLGHLNDAIALAEKAVEKIGAKLPELNYSLAMLFEKKGDTRRAGYYLHKYLEIVGHQYGHRRAIKRAIEKVTPYGKGITDFDIIKENKESLLARLMTTYLFCLNVFASLEKAPKTDLEKTKVQIGYLIESVCESYRDIVGKLFALRLANKEKLILAKYLNLFSLGYILQLKLADVEGMLKKAISLAPKDAEESQILLYAYYIVKVFQGVSDEEEHSLLQNALKLNAKPGHAHILLTRHYCSKRDFKKVEKIWNDMKKAELTYELTPQEREMSAEAKFGVSLWRSVARIIQGKDSDAFDILMDLRKQRPEAPELKYWLTIVYIRKGEITKAKEVFHSIPAGVLPEKISQEIRGHLEPVRKSSIDSHALLANLRSPSMTGCSSSPIVSRRY